MRAGQVAADVFDRAVELVLGRRPGTHRIRMSGKTDPQIAREILVLERIAEHDLDHHVDGVIGHLEMQLAAEADRIRADGYVLPGIPDVLEGLSQRGTIQSLLTGNVAANAAVKVGAFGLDRWLDFEAGAYGSDPHERRSDLVAVARERAAARYGEPPRAVLVGDTPLDVLAAREADARAVAVATGFADLDALRESEPDALLQDLSDT